MARIRVHEAAQRAGVSSRDVLAMLSNAGEHVQSASSVLTEAQALLVEVQWPAGSDPESRPERRPPRSDLWGPETADQRRRRLAWEKKQRDELDKKWRLEWIAPEDQRLWMEVGGLRREEPHVAVRAAHAGIAPPDLKLRLGARTVKDWLATGRDPAEVAALIAGEKAK